MDLGTGSARLGRGLKNLRVRWDETRSFWNDRMSDEYEERHIVLMEQTSLSVLREIDRLNQVMMQAQAECQ